MFIRALCSFILVFFFLCFSLAPSVGRSRMGALIYNERFTMVCWNYCHADVKLCKLLLCKLKCCACVNIFRCWCNDRMAWDVTYDINECCVFPVYVCAEGDSLVPVKDSACFPLFYCCLTLAGVSEGKGRRSIHRLLWWDRCSRQWKRKVQ